MATHRPKSLNEINNFYDKTLTSRNAIKVNETAITAVTEKKAEEAAPAPEEDILPSANASIGDLTADIQKFINDFSNPVKQEEKPLPKTTLIKPSAVKPTAVKPQTVRKNEKTAPAVKAEKKQEAPAEKPEILMTAEKNELFEEYMRIMSDEDDDAFLSKSRQKRKRKAKKNEDIYEAEEQIITADSSFTPEAPDHSAPESFTVPEYTPSFTAPVKEDEPEEDSDFDISFEQEEPVKEKKSRFALQLILIIGLLLTLIAALSTTLVNVVFKVNSGETFADKYYLYTVSKDDTLLQISKGDLILAVKEEIKENDMIAYYNSDIGAYDFAVKRSDVGDNMTLAENSFSNGEINVFNTNIRGKLSKAYHSVGTVAALAVEHFTVILGALMAIALILILILAFAFGRSDKSAKKYDYDDDDDDLFDFEDNNEGYEAEEETPTKEAEEEEEVKSFAEALTE